MNFHSTIMLKGEVMSNINSNENTYTTLDLYLAIKNIFSADDKKYYKNYKVLTNQQSFKGKDLRKLLSIISYIPPLWIIAMLVYPNDETVVFHVNQSISLCFAVLFLDLLADIINFMLILISPNFIVITSLMYIIIDIIVIAYIAIGCINARSSKNDFLPIIGNIYKFI